ncbi:MAG: hypothetical protein QW193_04820 [Nitrososphaerales archaeon]
MEKSKRIRILKYEYLNLGKKLLNIKRQLEESNKKLEKLKEMESKIDRGENLDENEIGMIGLPDDAPSFRIKFRLTAELKKAYENIKKYSNEYNSIIQLMRNMEVCPECEGTGVRKGKTEYVRLEGGIITPSFESESCELCGGEGKIDFGEVKESLKKLEHGITEQAKPESKSKRTLENLIKEFKEGLA